MIVTTTPTIEGHTIKEYKGLVSGEVIFGMNFLKDIGASLRDFFGGRTESYESAMLEGRETAQKEMLQRAKEMGANAIVGVSFGYETMGQGNSMIMISISGTAVVIDRTLYSRQEENRIIPPLKQQLSRQVLRPGG